MWRGLSAGKLTRYIGLIGRQSIVSYMLPSVNMERYKRIMNLRFVSNPECRRNCGKYERICQKDPGAMCDSFLIKWIMK